MRRRIPEPSGTLEGEAVEQNGPRRNGALLLVPGGPSARLEGCWRRWAWALLALCAVGMAGPATVLADVRTEARQHFRRGMRLIAEDRLVEGIAELEEAYRILPHPNVLYNIGRAHLELGNLDAARDAFVRYLESDPPDAVEVEGLVDDLDARITRRRAADAVPGGPGARPPEAAGSTEVDAAALAALEETAQRTARLAAEGDDPALAAEAARLESLAARLGMGSRGPPGGPEASAAVDRPGGSSTGENTALPPDLAVGERRQDVYEERIVSASRLVESPLDAPNSTTVVTEQDIRLSGLSGMVPIGELLRRVAGVEVMSLGPSVTDVSIRGLNQRLSNKVLVLVDGRSVFLDFIGATFWNLVPVAAEDIERIEVIRGPASAVYGADAFTGVINILTRNPGAGRSYATVGAGNGETIHGAASLTSRAGPVGLRVSGGYDRTNQWRRELGDDRVDYAAVADDPDLAIERAHVRAEARYTTEDRLQLEAGTGLNVADTAFYGISRFRQLFARDALFAQTHLGLRSPAGLGVRTFWNAFRADVAQLQEEPGGLPVTSTVDTHVVDVEVDWTGEAELGFLHQITIGAGYRFKFVSWDWIGDRDRRQHHVSGYVQDAMRVADWLRLQLSARVDRHPLLEGVQFSPRGAVVLRPSEGSSIRATVGRAFRSPTFLESYLDLANPTPFRGVTALARGDDENLDPERITSFELGVASQDLDVLTVEVAGYYNLVDDLILLSEVVAFSPERFGPEGDVSFDEERAAFPLGTLTFDNLSRRFRQIGGEAGVRAFPIAGLDVYANYAIHDTQPIGNGQGDRDDPRLEVDQRTSRHKVNGGVQIRTDIGLDLSVDVHWVSSQVWEEQVTDPVTGVAFQVFELPAYLLLNARVGWRVLDDQLELAVSGFNLLNDDARQHPFGQRMDLRVLGTLTGRFDTR